MKKVFFFLNASDRVVVATLVTIFAIALMAVFFTSCSREDCPELPDARLDLSINADSIRDLATISFVCQGDFTMSTSPMTRSLEADGKSMTDLWVLDYPSEAIQPSAVIHQTSSDADFGTPTLSLALGTHHLYFIASRGQSPTLNTTNHTLTFGKILDTFWKDYEITITAGTSVGSRNVALDRIVTRLKVTFSDAIPDGAASFNVTPASWHYGFDYLTGNPTSVTASQAITVNIPNTSIGKTDQFLSIYGFSSTTEWTTDIALSCKASNNDVLGSATIADAPFLRNRSSDYTGLLFTDNGGWTLSLNTDWTTAHTGTW